MDRGGGPAAVNGADVEALVVAADPELGKRQYIFCQACHTTATGGANKVGPNLAGIFGRPAAQGEGFIYSDSLSSSGIVWDEAALDQWIKSPATMVPGTTMVFAGVQKASDRANLIAYLKQATATN